MSPNVKKATLIYGKNPHYLDHLAAVSDLLEIPLIVTDKEIESTAKKYYPYLKIQYINSLDAPNELVAHYDVIFSCMPRILFDEIVFFSQALLKKRVKTVWVPHGNSDKGHSAPFMEALEHEEASLLYGNKMTEFLKEKKALGPLKNYVLMGNLRWLVYRKHQAYYRSVVEQEIAKKLTQGNKTILYAPTWQDAEKSSSFLDAAPVLLKEISDDFNLIVKLHPNHLLMHKEQIEEIIHQYSSHPQILILKDFSPIYPLLDFIDIYIGDMSSIGYDCLTFNKPMYFLNQNKRHKKVDPGLYLYRCGIEIQPDDYSNIYPIMKENLSRDSSTFTKIRKQVYEYTFEKEKPWSHLKDEITQMCDHLSDKNVSILSL